MRKRGLDRATVRRRQGCPDQAIGDRSSRPCCCGDNRERSTAIVAAFASRPRSCQATSSYASLGGRSMPARIVVTEFVSLDGVMEAPGGEPEFKYPGWTFEF